MCPLDEARSALAFPRIAAKSHSSDLGPLLSNFQSGAVVGFGDGDLNGDGAVTSSDLGLLLAEFGHMSQAASASAVPKPSGWFGLLLAVSVGFAMLRRK